MEAKKSITYTINLAPGLTTIFIVFTLLKVFGYVNWSWWLITSPMWFFPAIALACIAFVLVFMAMVGIWVFLKEVFK